MRKPTQMPHSPGTLPKPRKTPRQQRSQATVGYIVEAARQILYSEGVEAVTTRRVAERSGVAVGSLYQYFPNRDAILARLAEEEVIRESAAMQQYFNEIRKLPIHEHLLLVSNRIVETERRMLAFGGDFYRRYVQHYQVVQRVGKINAGEILDVETLLLDSQKNLELHGDEICETDLKLAAYLLARGIPAMLRSMVSERPELLASPRLSLILSRLSLAIVDGVKTADPER
ncbi:TetR/AcrR family transcriptional regulator [Denitratisoma sp. DHT3]|uniref:TetR/AcrR family transcriptional regulator n=1 Tax=Denitratisoma sp. DHT3 TaxID=1981880 RepID=UPI00164500DD|nr:TetR/AcrR family transcriptional regulator [Denitratisoma sp. DHT3]